MSSKEDVLVVGFGAVGVIYSYILTLAGKANVTCVARSNYQATLDNGIDIQSKRYGNIPGWRPYRIFESVADACDRQYSYVLVTTKAVPEIAHVSSLLAPLFSFPGTSLPVFVMVQNGLNVEKELFNTVQQLNRGEPKIICTALWICTNILPGNIVDHSSDERLDVGIYRPEFLPRVKNDTEEVAILQGFAYLFEGSSSPITIHDEVQKIKFTKNLLNASFAACSALMRCRLAAFFEGGVVEETIIAQMRAMIHEILLVGRAMGFDEEALPTQCVEDVIARIKWLHKGTGLPHRPSICLDLESGRPMEVEVILGELVRNARKLGVETPRLDLIYSMLFVLQNQFLPAKLL